jgi:competence protein ComEC
MPRMVSGVSVAKLGSPPPMWRPAMLTCLAVCFATGIAVGSMQARPSVKPWMIAACAFAIVALLRQRSLRVTALSVAVVCCGAAWMTLRTWHVAPDDPSAWLGDESMLVRVEGRALSSPMLRRPTGGSLAHFDYRPAATYFPMRIERILGREGQVVPVRGRAHVRIGETVAPFHAGDRVEVTGYLIVPEGPRNPGEFDIAAYARALGQVGWLLVPSRELLEVTPAKRSNLSAQWLRWREKIQRRAGGWLLASLPGRDAESLSQRDLLLKALLLGQRDPELDGLTETFQRLGLAHLLAISGLHLGMLAGMVLLIARAFGQCRLVQGCVVILVVLGYLFLIEVRLPVMRAGVMTIAACFALILGRRLSMSGAVGLSAIGLLVWRPDQLFTAGFQLSFGVVLGLIHLQPIVRRTLFGPPNNVAASSAEMIGQWLLSTTSVAITAWLIAAPIAMHHFGFITPAGIPLTVILMPLVALLLGIGYAKMLLEIVSPTLSLLLGIPLAICADAAVSLVDAVDALPGAVWHTPFPSGWWTLAALSMLWMWIGGGGLVPRRIVAVLATGLALWLFWPVLPHERPQLRIDMLAVGDGSCFVVRSGGKTFVFDAGSNTSFDAGRRWIIPAMRRLGVRGIDALAISHPDLDHYSAVLELSEEFRVQRVLVTPQFIEHAQQWPESPVAFVTDALTRRFVLIETVEAGHTMTLGSAHLTLLHPHSADGEYGRDNDRSMVIAADAAGRRVLFTGDLERAGIARLMPREPALRADIVELPHHGSYNDLAAELLTHLEPAVVMQSTGRTRWLRDRWAEILAGTERLVTHRDGACRIEIAADGTISTWRFRERNKIKVRGQTSGGG